MAPPLTRTPTVKVESPQDGTRPLFLEDQDPIPGALHTCLPYPDSNPDSFPIRALLDFSSPNKPSSPPRAAPWTRPCSRLYPDPGAPQPSNRCAVCCPQRGCPDPGPGLSLQCLLLSLQGALGATCPFLQLTCLSHQPAAPGEDRSVLSPPDPGSSAQRVSNHQQRKRESFSLPFLCPTSLQVRSRHQSDGKKTRSSNWFESYVLF